MAVRDYILLDYIQSTGTQYIDTGWHPLSSNLRLNIKYTPTGSTTIYSPCGNENASYGNARWLFVLFGQGYQRAYPLMGTWNNNIEYFDTPINSIVNIDWIYNDGVSTLTDSISGKKFTHTQQGDNITNHLGTLKIFQNIPSQKIQMKLYFLKLWDNDVLVRDFIPVKRKSDNVVGLYDLINDEFYTNAGTGEFIAGNIKAKKLKLTYLNNRLPSGYTQLEYIESTGQQTNATATKSASYIDTEFIPTLGTRIELKQQFTTLPTGSNEGVCGCNSPRFAWGLGNFSTKKNFYFGLGKQNIESTVQRDTNTHIFKLNYVDKTWGVDNASGSFTETGDTLPVRSIYLCARNSSGQTEGYANKPCNCKIYYFKLWENGVLLRYLIPAKRNSNNAIGMYDIVNNKFHPNIGNKAFTAGNVLGIKLRLAYTYDDEESEYKLRLPYIQETETLGA